MSRLIALFLALSIALTSQAFAVARGQSAATGEMAICIEGGFVVVPVDAQGKPTGPAHVCPDAVVAMAAVSIAPTVPVRDTTRLVAVLLPQAHDTFTPRVPTHVQARAPPVPV